MIQANAKRHTRTNRRERRMCVITFGTFDLFHIGHVRLLRRAKELGDRLIVGVSTDDLSKQKKHRSPVFTLQQRMETLMACRYVDETFVEQSLAQKRQYLRQYEANVLVMGDDWKGKFDEFGDICRVVYLARTPLLSTSAVIETIKLERGVL